MSRSNLRIAVIVFTVITLLVHAYLGLTSLPREGLLTSRGGPSFGLLWTLNFLGYTALLVTFLDWVKVPFLKGKNIGWALMAFAFITILAWVFLSGVLRNGLAGQSRLAVPDKIDEVLLVISSFLYTRRM